MCVDANSFTEPPACAVCGNGILEEGEQCDNGNQAGCEKCKTADDHACYGELGGGSVCVKKKVIVCGDGIFDYG